MIKYDAIVKEIKEYNNDKGFITTYKMVVEFDMSYGAKHAMNMGNVVIFQRTGDNSWRHIIDSDIIRDLFHTLDITELTKLRDELTGKIKHMKRKK